MFNTNPFHRLPPASFYSSFSIRLYQRPQQGSVVWVDGVPQRKSWSLVAVFFCFCFCFFFFFFLEKAPLASHLFPSVFSVFCLYRKVWGFLNKACMETRKRKEQASCWWHPLFRSLPRWSPLFWLVSPHVHCGRDKGEISGIIFAGTVHRYRENKSNEIIAFCAQLH